MLKKVVPMLVAAMLLGSTSLAVAGCGGSDEPSAPTTVSAADLDKDGHFWRSLTPDLKDDLIDLGKDRLGAERPDGAAVIRAYSTSDLVAEVDKDYTNAAKLENTIYRTYSLANNKIARGEFDEAIGALDELCNSDPAPEQCK